MQGDMRVAWLFGLLHFPVRFDGKASEPSKKASTRRPFRHKRKGSGLRLVRSGEFWFWLRALLRRLLGQIHIYSLYLRLRLGLGDPADTGKLWALMGPVAVLVSSIPFANVHIEPNFMDAELLMESDGEIRIYPLQLIAIMIMILLSPSTWRLVRRYRS